MKPIFKSGSTSDSSNYRPIGILSPFAKILERLVYNQLTDFLEKHSILYKYPFGFRKGHSTEQTILEYTDELKESIDEGEYVCSICFYLAKAFDAVNHELLLKKLYTYGVRGTPLLWFTSYFENRMQYVEIENTTSNSLNIRCGVPRGSTL